jgi:mannose-6-phosphate isomerase-like protein (cupin superfamily)
VGRLGHLAADDVVYVVSGEGDLRTGFSGSAGPMLPGIAGLIPPLVPADLSNPGRTDLVVVSVLSPPPFSGAFTVPARDRPVAVIHEGTQDDLPAGDDRHFRFLITPEHGARNVTQFVGFIEKSRAPFHTHTYEEAIYILSGSGIVHIEGLPDQEISEGTSIFPPAGDLPLPRKHQRGDAEAPGRVQPPGLTGDEKGDPRVGSARWQSHSPSRPGA